jgi:hypothetical protein
MTWAIVAVAGASLVTGYMGQKSAKDASKATQQGAQAGLDFTKQVYQDSQGNFQPYLQLGQQGVGGLSDLMGGDYSGFYESPDYMAARDAMTYGFDHSAAARGRLFSGGYPVDLSAAQGDLAAGYLGNYRNALFNMVQGGQNAAGTLGGIGSGTSQMVNNQNNLIGQARATGYQQAGGAIAGAVNGLAGAFGNYMGQPQTQSSYGTNNFGIPGPVDPYSQTNWGG